MSLTDFASLIPITYAQYMSDYLLALLICVLGAFAKEMYNVKAQRHINRGNIMLSSFVSTVSIRAIDAYIHISPVELYIFVCFLSGFMSSHLVLLLLNTKFVIRIIINFCKLSPDNAMKAIAQSLEDAQKEKDEKNKKSNDKNDGVEE